MALARWVLTAHVTLTPDLAAAARGRAGNRRRVILAAQDRLDVGDGALEQGDG
jgi:hypothetical protein